MLANKLLSKLYVPKLPISVSSTFIGSIISGTGTTTVTITGHSVGDMLVAIGGAQIGTEPTYTAGWTRATGVALSGSARSMVAVYKIATSTASESITFTGGGNTSSAPYSSALIIKNATTIGATGTTSDTGTGTLDVPALSLVSPSRNLIIAAYYTANLTAISGTPSMTLFPASTSMGGYLLNADSFPSGRTATVGSTTRIFVSFELF